MTAPTTSERLARTNLELIELVEELAKKFQSSESVDAEAFLAQHPEHADQLRQLLPTVRVMADFGISGHDPDLAAATPQSPEPAAGVLGDFRIIREIGRGGMGVVYEAEQISMRRRVALKVLPFAAVMDDKQIRRFKNEALAAGQLQHTSIVPVYSVGCERGVHFYAMQYIDGQTLAEVIRELKGAESRDQRDESHRDDADDVIRIQVSGDQVSGTATVAQTDRLPITDHRLPSSTSPVAALSTDHSAHPKEYFRAVARLGVQAAEALEHAHESGVIHRDIKPSNLLLDKKGNLWITDFGLAHFQTDTNLTMTGDLIGTLRYMSPEQALAKRVVVDHRTDIYSLGATLYELLTLQPAFGGEDRQELLRQIAFDEPRPLRRINDRIPPELETIVLKATAKNPTERYASALELAEDLGRFLKEKAIKARRPTLRQVVVKWARRHSQVLTWACVVAVVALLIGGALVWLQRNEALKQWTRAENNYHVADQERIRANENLKLARKAVDEMYTEVAGTWTSETPQMERTHRAFLKKALEFYQEFSKINSDDAELRTNTALAFFRVGDIHQWLCEFAESEAAYQSAIVLLEPLVANSEDPASVKLYLGRSLGHLAFSLYRDGKAQDAERTFRHAMAFDRDLAGGAPMNAEYRSELAHAISNFGLFLSSIGRFQEEEAAYWEAMPIKEALVKEFPANADYRESLSFTYQGMARLLRDSGRFEQAEDFYHRTLQLQEEVLAETPRMAGPRWWLALSYEFFGDLLYRTGRTNEAEEVWRKSGELNENLAKDFPTVPDYRATLASVEGKLAMLLDRFGRHNEAVGSLLKAAQIWEQARVNTPELPEQLQRAADASNRLGWNLNQIGEAEKAVDVLVKARELAELLVTQHPAVQGYRGTLAASNRNLGAALEGAGRPQDALRAISAALEIEQKLVADFPDDPQPRRGVALCQNNLAWFLATQDPVSLRDPQAAVALAKEATKAVPQRGPFWNTLGVAHYRVGDWQAAIESLEKAEELSPGDYFAYNAFFLAMAHWQLGNRLDVTADAKMTHHDEARQWFGRAIDWMEKNKPKDEELKRFRAEAEELLGLKE